LHWGKNTGLPAGVKLKNLRVERAGGGLRDGGRYDYPAGVIESFVRGAVRRLEYIDAVDLVVSFDEARLIAVAYTGRYKLAQDELDFLTESVEQGLRELRYKRWGAIHVSPFVPCGTQRVNSAEGRRAQQDFLARSAAVEASI